MRPIVDIAAKLDLQPDKLMLFGEHMAKLRLNALPQKNAQPKGKIVLVSAINKIEIWDKSKYKEFFETFTPQAFSELANAVMNKTTG